MVMPFDEFEKVLADGNDDDKIATLKNMRPLVADGEPVRFFELARQHVADVNREIRWQAIILIGEFIPFGGRNNEIWDVIIQFCGTDDDMQDALATVLLEHLLEHDFDRTVDRIRIEVPKKATPLLDLVKRCWQFGQPDAKWYQLQQVLENDIGVD